MTPSPNSLSSALQLAGHSDRFLLLGDGVTAHHAQLVAERGFYREHDVVARGLGNSSHWQALTAITDTEWVEMSLAAMHVVSWT